MTLDHVDDIDTFLDYMISESQKFLDRYRNEMEESSDYDKVAGNEIPFPPWFNNPEIYKPLLTTYSNVLQELETQNDDLDKAIKQLKQKCEVRVDPKKEETLQNLRRKRDSLLQQKDQIRLMQQSSRDKDKNYQNELQAKQAKLQQLGAVIEELEKDNKNKERELQSLIKDLDQVAKENQLISHQLKSTTAETQKNESKLQKCKADIEHFKQQRDLNYQKNESLKQQMEALSRECTEAQFKIDNLKEQLKGHNDMLTAFDLAKKQLEREKGIEQAVLTKMEDAVKRANDYNQDAERYKQESESLKVEVNRTKKDLSDTLKKLKEKAKNRIASINAEYEQKIIDADKRFARLLDENAQLAAKIERMNIQLSFLETQNSALRANESRPRTGYESFWRGAEEKLKDLQNELEDLTRKTQIKKEEELKQQMALRSKEAENEKALSAARETVDKLEADLAQVKASLSDAEAQGSALLAENNRLNSELTKVSIDSRRDVELKIAERENEIRLLTSQLDDMRRSHLQQKADLQTLLLKTKRHADEWKQQAQKVATQSEQGLEETEEQTQIYAQKIAALNAEIERQESEAFSLQQLVIKRQQEARDLQMQYEAVEKRVFDQKTQLDSLYEQQMQFATQREDLANRIDIKKTELKRLKREHASKAKYDDESKKKK